MSRQAKASPAGLPRLIFGLAALLGALAACAMSGQAVAAVTYTSETPIETGNQGIYGAIDVSVDQKTGNIYMTYRTSGVVTKSAPDGTLLNAGFPVGKQPMGLAYDSESYITYVQTFENPNREMFAFNDEGLVLTDLPGFPTHIPFALNFVVHYNLEVGRDGDVYYADRAETVYRLNHETGTPKLAMTCGDCPDRNFTFPGSVSVDGDGYILVADKGQPGSIPGRIVKLNPDGSFHSVVMEYPEGFPGSSSQAGLSISADPVTNDVFLGFGSGPTFKILAFNEAGEQYAEFGEGVMYAHNGAIPMINQIAVHGETGTVYVSDKTPANIAVARVFKPEPALLAETVVAKDVTSSGATLKGIANPNGNPTEDCHFEFGPTDEYGESLPCEVDPGDASIRTPVTTNVSGLEPDTTYHFKVVQTTSEGTVSGEDMVFTTDPPPAPSSETGTVSQITLDAATVEGVVNSNGSDANCQFEYGTDESYGATLPCSTQLVSGSEDVSVSAVLSGLQPDTTYHYRVSASNVGGTTWGADATFSTLRENCQTRPQMCNEADPVPPPPLPRPVIIQSAPPVEEAETLRDCLKSAKAAYRKSARAARRKRGKARARALRTAKRKRNSALRSCRRLHGRR